MGVGHLEHGRDTAHRGGPRAGFPIFLMGVARFTKMDMHVDGTRDQVEPCHINDVCRVSQASLCADGADTATGDRHIRQVTGGFIDDCAAS